jgi:hypothetical protein
MELRWTDVFYAANDYVRLLRGAKAERFGE